MTTAPYNMVGFGLTDQSAILRFFPHRDGLITDNWNVTYSGSSFADWSYDNNFGSGVWYSCSGHLALYCLLSHIVCR